MIENCVGQVEVERWADKLADSTNAKVAHCTMTETSGVIISLDNVAQIASDDITHAIQTVAQKFIASGGYGSLHMHLASNEAIVQTFRSVISEMIAEAKHIDGARLRKALDTHLSELIDWTLVMRRAHLHSANVSADDGAAICDTLHHDMKRLKDVAMRKFTMN